MPLSFFGTRTQAIPYLSGFSNKTGFIVEYRRFPLAQTRNYDGESKFSEEESRTLNLRFLVGTIAGGVGGSALLFFVSTKPIWSTLCFIPVVFILVAMQSFVWTLLLKLAFDAKSRWYHGCEHKVITLLWAGLTPTAENLKKCPKVSMWCGTSILLFVVNFISLLGNLLIAAVIMESGTYPRAEIVYFVSWFLYFLLAPFFVQFWFSVKEPTFDIIEEGLEVAREVYASYASLKNTP